MNYQFSVGTMTAGANAIGIMTEISVSYDGDAQSFYGGDYRLPMAIELGNRTGEISATSSRFSTGDGPLNNAYIDVVLGAGANGGGLSGTINACKVTSYNVTSTQNDFVTSDISLSIAHTSHMERGAAYNWS